PGTATGSTKADITETATSKFVVNVTDSEVATPNTTDAEPATGTNLIDDYTSGADITNGVAEGKYLQVYDVDANGKVAGFYQKQLVADDIKQVTLTYWKDNIGTVTALTGSGTETKPYQISSAEELAFFAKTINSFDNIYDEAYFELTQDIDLSGHQWTPVGDSSKDFNGYFDGNGYEISHVMIGIETIPNSTYNYVGLFANIGSDATIENVGVSVSIYSSTNFQVGGLVASNHGTINNCYTTGDIIANSANYIGGLVGYNYNGTINNCYATGDVTGEGDGVNIGGLVGYNQTNGTIINSHATGDMTGGSNAYVGGLIGNSVGTISNSYTTGNVTGGSGAYVGGLAGGTNTETIINSYATGNVTGGSKSWVGGLIGVNWGTSTISGYYNSDATQTVDGIARSTKQGFGYGTGGAYGIQESTMKASSQEVEGALVDRLNNGIGTNTDWFNWQQAASTNSGYPTHIVVTKPKMSTVETTSPVTNIKTTSATVGGNVTSDGNGTLSEIGIVYGTTENPTIDTATKVSSKNTATGTFSIDLTGLTPDTTYRVRAYATNEVGTSYGEDVEFTTVKEYTVTFNSNGGSAVNSQTIDYKTKVSEPKPPAKEGSGFDYEFGGWYKDKELTNKWDFANDTMPAEDITLYAKWLLPQDNIIMEVTPDTVEVNNDFNQIFTLDINNDTVIGTVYKSDLSLRGAFSNLSIGEISNKDTTVTASVYGNLSNEGVGIITLNDDRLVNSTSLLSANVNVVAKQKYTVTFKDYNGNELYKQTVTKGNKAIAPAAPTREGYTFTGWDKDFSNITSNLIITAKYKINQYKVSFESNGGSKVNLIIEDYGSKISKPTAPTKEGYTSGGWYKEAELKNMWDFDSDTIPANDITLYAKWNIKAFTVTFTDYDKTIIKIETVNYGSSATAPENPTRSGYTFKEWDKDFSNITSDLTVTANYSKNSNSHKSSGGGKTSSNQTGTTVIVNGKKQIAGTETVKEENGQKTVEVKADSKVISQKIDEALKEKQADNNTKENTIEIPVTAKDAKNIKGILTGDIIKKMEDNEFTLTVNTDKIDYIIPAKEVGIERVASTLGVTPESLKNIEVSVEIQNTDENIAKEITEKAKVSGYDIVFPPVEFKVVAKVKSSTNNETKEVTVSKFSNYIQRVMEVPEGVDPSKITTGIVYNPDGTFSHIPTSVFEKDGKWYAKLNSLTNSDYSVIWNPIKVASVENHWSKEAVNDMASRLVIDNPTTFKPDANITRGEFAEYITKALGLYRTGVAKEDKFTDVSIKNNLADAIEIATQYGIIKGCPDGTFKPDAKISREQAMVMYARAMDIVGLKEVDDNRIENYIDKGKIADWAYNDVKKTISVGVFNGKTNETINPKDTFTYAEAATAIRNLLIESSLINK
ncbi:InlB B-repeat-containing protein, partial [Sporosalibacterium faouarense]|uniref:InlB B-repeat-containing protein n=1 Tax=Sporosalibacterium faouarense TaxID=516123 RepID=UPI00192B98A8